MEKYYVYHIAPTGEENLSKGYIGITVDPDRRWKAHKRKVHNGGTHNVYDFIRQVGLDNVEFRVVEEYHDIHEAYAREEELRPTVYMGWNESIGGVTANMGVPVEYQGQTYSSVSGMARVIGIDWKTAKRLIDGLPTLTTGYESPAAKPVTIKCAKTGEERCFSKMLDAWEWIGKEGGVNGNIAKQTKKGRPAYGYYWEY